MAGSLAGLGAVRVVDVLRSRNVLFAQAVVVQARLEVLVVVQVEEHSVEVHDLLRGVEEGNSVQMWFDIIRHEFLAEREDQTGEDRGQDHSRCLCYFGDYDSVSGWEVSQVFKVVDGKNSSDNRSKSECFVQSRS